MIPETCPPSLNHFWLNSSLSVFYHTICPMCHQEPWQFNLKRMKSFWCWALKTPSFYNFVELTHFWLSLGWKCIEVGLALPIPCTPHNHLVLGIKKHTNIVSRFILDPDTHSASVVLAFLVFTPCKENYFITAIWSRAIQRCHWLWNSTQI